MRHSLEELINAFPPFTDAAKPSRKAPALAHETGPIGEGERNTWLTSQGGRMRNNGSECDAINTALQALNIEHCTPPLDLAEVETITRSIAGYPAGEGAVLRTLHDAGNAARFVDEHGADIRYVPEHGRWLVWNGNTWVPDHNCGIVEHAKITAAAMFNTADMIKDKKIRGAVEKHAKVSHAKTRLDAMVALSRTAPQVILPANSLDADPLLFAVKNGVIDLRTGVFRKAAREDYLTRCSDVAYEPLATCPQFEAFIREVSTGDTELVNYLQIAIGYTLTGLTNEQCLFFLYGIGANGKSTLLAVLKKLLGDYGKQASADTLMAKQHIGISNDIARLASARLVISTEVEQGSQLSEALIKSITGGDTVSARFLYQEHFEFQPQFKLWIAGNHRPRVRGTDDGIWRRVRLVPFTAHIPKERQDPDLMKKLQTELPGILNWAIKGCQRYLASGLPTPRVVQVAVEEYRADMDVLGQWLGDSDYELGSGLSEQAAHLYHDYRTWCLDNGIKYNMSSAGFSRALKDRGCEKQKKNTGTYYLGIGKHPEKEARRQKAAETLRLNQGQAPKARLEIKPPKSAESA